MLTVLDCIWCVDRDKRVKVIAASDRVQGWARIRRVTVIGHGDGIEKKTSDVSGWREWEDHGSRARSASVSVSEIATPVSIGCGE